MLLLLINRGELENLQHTYDTAYTVGSIIGLGIFLLLAIAISRGISWTAKTILARFVFGDQVRTAVCVATGISFLLLPLPMLLSGAWVHGGVCLFLTAIWLYVDIQAVEKTESETALRIY